MEDIIHRQDSSPPSTKNIVGHHSSPPSTKDVLGQHLHQKVLDLLKENGIEDLTTVDNGCSLADKATGMLLERPLKDIHTLLQDGNLLLENVRRVLLVLHTEYPHMQKAVQANILRERQKLSLEEVGEMIYERLCDIEEPMAAQITGMLLELDTQTLYELISKDTHLLETAVKKAKEVLGSVSPSDLTPSTPPDPVCTGKMSTSELKFEQGQQAIKEELGQQLYDRILKVHPECASDLTGMILELGLPALKQLLGNKQQLQLAITKAYTEWAKYSEPRISR